MDSIWGITRLIELLFFPPGIFIILLLLSVLLTRSLKQLKRLILLQAILIYLLCIPVTTHFLFASIEDHKPLNPEQISSGADIIVVLAGGIKALQQEYQRPDIGNMTRERLRYAAWLHKKTQLPILVTGGIKEQDFSEAQLMKQVLQNEYGVKGEILVEQDSQNTYENSFYTQELLLEKPYRKIYLVTHAYHMRRAIMVFKQHHKHIQPAPMGFYHNSMDYLASDFFPNSLSMRLNYLALHEIVGRYWYQLRY
jgi:uncharacterized SAM-binding protein YcdF (DUF218 family)